MAASPLSIAPAPVTSARRPRFALTQRRLEANRRNARYSSGPRTAAGKARVARNAIKHGFFVAQERWTPEEQRDFETTLEGLRDDFEPQSPTEESCVRTIAESYVRMAAMLRYENIAALKEHRRRECELELRIAAASPCEAARMGAGREQLRREGLWRPTIPGPRDAMAILRYQRRLDRTIRHAVSALEGREKMRIGSVPAVPESQKANRRETSSSGVVSRSGEGPRTAPSSTRKFAKTNPLRAMVPDASRSTSNLAISATKSAKTNPLTAMFMGNRHQRRRARALAKRRR
jgi:hypothetical protein